MLHPFTRLRDWLLSHPTGRWVVLGSCVGILCGLAAAVFEVGADVLSKYLLTDVAGAPAMVSSNHAVQAVSDPEAFNPLYMLAIMTAGGLIAGIIIMRFSLQARGGGIGVVVDSFHHKRGHIPISTTWTKLVATIVSLGSGGSGGREGPISLVGAGFASWFAGRLHLTARDRRILLVAGIAGGIAAAFRAPLAAAIFAAEVLYRDAELESDVIIPCFIAAVVAYLVGSIGLDLLGPLVGHPGVIASSLFKPEPAAFGIGDWKQLGGYTLVALGTAVAARWFITVNDKTARRFELLKVPFWCKPALGALLAGFVAIILYVIVLFVLRNEEQAQFALATIGTGYGVLHGLFAGLKDFEHRFIIAALLGVLAISKAFTTALTVGSGGSAGLFGPSIVIGGCVGGAIGFLLVGTPVAPPVTGCVLMGMAGMLAASHRTPVAALLMVSEIAGTYLLLLPAMWVTGVAFLFTGRRSLIPGQVDTSHDSPAHRNHLFADVLANAKVADLLITPRDWTVIPPSADIERCRTLMAPSSLDQFPVVNDDGKLIGIIERSEVAKLGNDPMLNSMVLADDLAGGAGSALRATNSLSMALSRLHQQHVDELPVVDEKGMFLGMVTSGMLMEHYRIHVERVAAERKEEGFTVSQDGSRKSDNHMPSL